MEKANVEQGINSINMYIVLKKKNEKNSFMSFWRNSKIVSCALGGKIYLYIGHNIYSRVFQLLFIHLVAVLDENVVRTGSQILEKH